MLGSDEGDRGPFSLLTSSELQARRASSRQRRDRRRAVSGAILLLFIVGVTVGLATRPGSHRRDSASQASRVASRGLVTGRRPVPRAPSQSGYAFEHQTAGRILGYTSYIRLGTARVREVALTFDDGPGPYTPKILQILARTHTHATFFAIGEEVQRYPQFVRAEAQEGSEVGDHTEIHPYMADLTSPAQQAQIVEAANAIHRAGAPLPTLWRPPYGSFNAQTIAILNELRMVMVLWTVDTSDYALPGVRHIWYTALSGARPGAIILMHDGGGNRSETVAALPRIIAGLRRRGYRLVTVSQLLATDPPPHGQPPPQPLTGGS